MSVRRSLLKETWASSCLASAGIRVRKLFNAPNRVACTACARRRSSTESSVSQSRSSVTSWSGSMPSVALLSLMTNRSTSPRPYSVSILTKCLVTTSRDLGDTRESTMASRAPRSLARRSSRQAGASA